MHKIWYFWVLLWPQLLWAQNREIEVHTGAVPGVEAFNYNETLKGSPYLVDQWSKGSIKLTNSKSYPNQNLKYDIYRDELIVQNQKNGDILLVPKSKVAAFSFIDSTGVRSLFQTRGNTYYQVLSKGRVTLLAKHGMYLVQADPAGNFATKSNDELKLKKPKFFVMRPNQKLINLRTNIKHVAVLLPDQAKALKAFQKQHALDLKNTHDLVKLFDFYNSNHP